MPKTKKKSKPMAKGTCRCTSNHRKYCRDKRTGKVQFKAGRC